MNNLIVTTYSIYLPIAILLTFIVAKIFFKNSRIFMMDIFRGRSEIAMSTNRLFEVGFYLFSLGFALFRTKINYAGEFGKQQVFEHLSYQIGILTVFLGIMVFTNLYLLFRGKKKTRQNSAKHFENQGSNDQDIATIS
ncbi:hypothetical protein GYB22_02380 [bacterium]|nr:hypothetical protein [bacterium]